MCIRCVNYGYKIENGNFIINNYEAEIVKKIFTMYIGGLFFQQIANDLRNNNVEYNNGECDWSKRKVARIIQNNIYKGNEEYPKIIEDDMFENANAICKKRNTGKLKIDPNIELIKKHLYCESCGKLYIRKADRIRTERWYCPNECLTDKKLTDEKIINGISDVVLKASEYSIDNKNTNNKIKNDVAVNKYISEIANLLKSKEPNFQLGKELIYKCISEKFKCCKENRAIIYKDKVNESIKKFKENESFDYSIIEGIIDKILVTKEGKIKILFINDMVISE